MGLFDGVLIKENHIIAAGGVLAAVRAARAAGVIRVAVRMGINIPAELSVAGCDDIALAQQIFPALTTINQPLSAMSERAVYSVIEKIRTGKIEDDSVIVPSSIVVRESTGPAPGS